MSNRQIIPYNAQLMRDHGKEAGWHRQKSNLIVINERLGYGVHHVIVADENGVPIYDMIINAERGGGVFLPEDGNGKFGLQKNWRPQTRDMDLYQQKFPYVDYSNLGKISLEIPRGFAKTNEIADETIVRETEEETGGSIVSKTDAGYISANTALDAHMTKLAYGVVDLSKKPKNEPDPNEAIVGKLEFYSITELSELRKSGQLYDSFTLSSFAARLLEEPEKFFLPELLG